MVIISVVTIFGFVNSLSVVSLLISWCHAISIATIGRIVHGRCRV